MLNSAKVYQSLTEPSMILGLPQTPFMILVGAMLVFAGAVDFNLIALAIAPILFLLLLPILRKMFEREPLSLDLTNSYMRWPSILPHHGSVHAEETPDVVSKSLYH